MLNTSRPWAVVVSTGSLRLCSPISRSINCPTRCFRGGAAEAVELPEHQHIAGTQVGQQRVKLGALSPGATGDFAVQLVASGLDALMQAARKSALWQNWNHL